MDINQIKENKLKFILQFSIPSIISMLLQTAITITDAFFTGNYVGENALAAINLGLPILYFFLGIGLCVGVGGSVISGRLLGKQNSKKASEVFSQTMITSAVYCIATSVIIFVLFTPILSVLRADGELSVYFNGYYKIMLFTYPLMVVGTILGMFIRTDGKPQVCMLVGIIGCILNAVLDYVFVGALRMGVEGSAIASLIVQAITVAVQFVYFMKPERSIHFTRFGFDKSVNKETLINGSSEFIGEMASAISMFAFNYVLMKYVGSQGVAAFTILGFAVYGFSMIAIGFGQGLTPLVSICWGANEQKTAMELRSVTNKILLIIGLLFAVAFSVFGNSYAAMFGCSDVVANMVASGFRIYAATFLVMGFDVINKAIDFIFDNIDNEITVDDVARHCSYSEYHLMRMFKEHTDEALYQFIKRTRIERSAWRLKVEKDKSITEIGVDYGYSSSNFATAFKRHLNITPANFRNVSEQLAEQCSFSHGISIDELVDTENLITVEELDSFFVLYERKKGNYHNLPDEWCTFINKYEHLSSADTLYLESTVDDPSITDENCCMYEMCQTISPNHPALKDNPNILTHTFAGGKYAVYHFKGYPQMLYMVYQGVFCRWLSKTGNHIDERPVFDIYRKVEENGYMEIDICFPLK